MDNHIYPVFAYGKWGLVDRSGNQAIPIIYTFCNLIINQLSPGRRTIIVIKDDKYGVLDTDSLKEIIPTIYDKIRCYGDEYSCILRDRIWYMWEKGSLYEIGECNFVGFINEEFILIEFENDVDKLESVYSIAEKSIIPRSEIHIFYNDLAIVRIDGKFGFINRSLELIIPAIYDYIEHFENGFAYAEIGKEEYYIDTKGQQVISGPFYHNKDLNDGDGMLMEGIWEGVVCYEENGYVGLKGLYNKIVTPPIYDFINLWLLHFDAAIPINVIKDQKEGLIDKDGNIIIPCEYDSISSEKMNFFVVGKNYLENDVWKQRKHGIIDTNNSLIIPAIYNHIGIINDYLAIVTIDSQGKDKYGVLNILFQEFVIPPIYDRCHLYADLFLVEKNNKWGYLDSLGNEIMKVEQDFDYYIYKDSYYCQIDDERWSWVDDKNGMPNLSKCNNEKEVCFKGWNPI